MPKMFLSAVAGALLLSGCSASAPAVDDATSIDGTAVVLATAVGFDELADGDGAGDAGALLLVDADGELTTLAAPGLDGPEAAYRDGNLYFADARRDHVVGRDKVVHRRKWREYTQHHITAVKDGYVTVFNSNADEKLGYKFDVSIGTSADAKQYEVGGWFDATAACGDDVYALVSDNELTGDTHVPRVLQHLNGPSGPEPITTWTEPRSLDLPLAASCSDNELVFLTNTYEKAGQEGPLEPRMYRWKVGQDKAPTHVDLTASNGKPLDPEKLLSTHDRTTIQDGAVWWIDASLMLRRTELGTGTTSEVGTIELDDPDMFSNDIVFGPGTVHVLNVPEDGAASLTTHRLSDLSRMDRITIPGLRPKLNADGTEVSGLTVIDPAALTKETTP